MNISFSPIRADRTLDLSKSGETLIVNNEPFDFSELPDGASLPKHAVSGDWLASDVVRVDGKLELTILLPIGPVPTPASAFPADLVVTEDGPIKLPE